MGDHNYRLPLSLSPPISPILTRLTSLNPSTWTEFNEYSIHQGKRIVDGEFTGKSGESSKPGYDETLVSQSQAENWQNPYCKFKKPVCKLSKPLLQISKVNLQITQTLAAFYTLLTVSRDSRRLFRHYLGQF
jgi:hypothetical protein